jgi:Anti-sigma-K factor rskA, C-terminal
MEHAEALELIADAAARPGELATALDGADPAWQSLREHLAACGPCREETAAWREVSAALAAAGPDPALVERVPSTLKASTLALVRATGVERSGIGPGRVAPILGATLSPGVGTAERSASRAAGRPGTGTGRHPWLRAPRRGWPALAGIAAVVALVAVIGGAATALTLDRQLQSARGDRAELARVAGVVDRLMQAPDRQVVVLTRTDGSGQGGSVVWSAASGTLVVLSETLAQPPVGMAYRCWVAYGGTRQPVGQMHFAGGLAYWAGPIAQWGGTIQPGDEFGVSLVPVAGGSGGTPVLTGSV